MYIVGASVFSVIERYLRSVIWMNNLDQVITTKSQVSFTMFKELAMCGGLLFIRYVICSTRHMWAYYSAIKKRNNKLLNIQRDWLNNNLYFVTNRNIIQNTIHTIEKLGKQIEQSHARIAIDLIPGILSVCIGIYQLLYYIDAPMSYICIGYLAFLEIIYTISSKNLHILNNTLSLTVNNNQARLYTSLSETVINKEIVVSFTKNEYEISKTKTLIEESFINEMKNIKIFNILDSLVKWMSHLVYIGIIVMSRNSIITETHILWVLYFAKETRGGFQEVYNYFSVRNKESILVGELNNILLNKNNKLIEDSIVTNGEIIDIKLVTFSYSNKTIFNSITFSKNVFKKNAYTIIMGKNGSGKSTLCKILSGYQQNITVLNNGKCTIPKESNTLICEQLPLLFESQSVLYNIVYGTDYIYNNRYTKHKEMFIALCKKLDMQDKLDFPVSVLSGGERQKVCLLRSYIKALNTTNRIDLFILDEWNSALDMHSKHQGFSLINEIKNKTGCAVVWVSHVQIPQLITCQTTKAVILDSVYSHKEGNYRDLWDVYQEE